MRPLPYLYRAVMNRAVMHLRQRRVRDRWRDQVAAVARMDGEPADTRLADDLEMTELMRAVAEVIDTLPQCGHLIFTMSWQQDLTYKQIAQILGIPAGGTHCTAGVLRGCGGRGPTPSMERRGAAANPGAVSCWPLPAAGQGARLARAEPVHRRFA